MTELLRHRHPWLYRLLDPWFPRCVYCGRLLIARTHFREAQAGHLCKGCL